MGAGEKEKEGEAAGRWAYPQGGPVYHQRKERGSE
jgi:hypothetical protein